MIPAANNGIHFPIAEPTPGGHDGRAVVNTDPVDKLAAPIIGTISLAVALPTPQMPMELTAGGFVLEDMLIDPFRADRAGLLPLEPPTDLFGTPVLSKLGVDLTPGGRGNPRTRFGLWSLEGEAMSLVGPVASLASVPSHLTRDRGLMNAQDLGNRGLSLLGVQQGRDLIPCFLGELGVGSHECSFDWLIERDAVEPTAACP